MKSKIIKVISFILLLSFFAVANAYDFRIGQQVRTLNDTLKDKADLVVKKKINTTTLINKYLKALKKINVNALSQEKQALYYYLLSRLDKNFVITKVENNSSNISSNNTNTTSTGNNTSTNSTISTNTQTNSNSTNNSSVSGYGNSLGIREYTVSEQKIINTSLSLPPNSGVSNTSRIVTYTNLGSSQRSYIESIKSKVEDYAEVNSDYEFEEYGKTYRVKFKEYYNIDFSNPVEAYLQIQSIGNEILVRQGNQFLISKGGFTFEQKLSLTDIKNKAKFDTESDDPVLFQSREGYYYAYALYDYKYFTIPEDGAYLSQYNNLPSIDTTLLVKKDGKYLLVTDYKEYKLFDIPTLKYTSDPLPILKSLGKDLYFYKGTDFSDIVQQIKTKTNEIISGTNNESQRIQKVYSWLTLNLSYDPYTTQFVKGNFDEATYLANVNNEVFTGLGTFKTKNGVCDGFTKLMQYMLAFAGVQNVIIETGNADVGGGKIISHAWINIGTQYYDPTWDLYSGGDISKFKRFGVSQSEMYKNHFKLTQ